MNIGGTIATVRRIKNIPQIDIANQLGLSVSTLSLLENGKRKFPPNRLSELAVALGVPVMFIVVSSLSPDERADVPPTIMAQLDNWRMEIWAKAEADYINRMNETED